MSSTQPSSKEASQSVTPVTSRPASRERSSASTPNPGSQAASLDKTPDDPSKFRTFLSILKNFIGVSDLASVRFSLPAQLMEPIPNLEYWHYLDRPETFISIPDSDDPLGRMLGALRFWFSKDLKYVKGKPCKPYNSTLGEFFRCNWDVTETDPPPVGNKPANTTEPTSDQPFTLSFFCEQTSHHPPVSAYYIYCPEKGISARGYDQLQAKFTGTSVRVAPGEYNKGIFITLDNYDNEEYNLTHPVASLGGLLRGTLNISVADSCFVTCAKTRLKAILTYQEERWIGKAQNKMTGVIFKYDPDNDTRVRIKDVPDSDVVVRLEGCWHEQIYFTLGSKSFDKSLPNESRKYWADVTDAILDKQWNEAQRAKNDIEDRQRAKKAERDAEGKSWTPRFFTGSVEPAGTPELNEEGKEAVEKLHEKQYELKENAEMAA
ncbi:MAG: hypothetical protein Q9162_003419 [Coniocarpon cinnabarinum]